MYVVLVLKTAGRGARIEVGLSDMLTLLHLRHLDPHTSTSPSRQYLDADKIGKISQTLDAHKLLSAIPRTTSKVV